MKRCDTNFNKCNIELFALLPNFAIINRYFNEQKRELRDEYMNEYSIFEFLIVAVSVASLSLKYKLCMHFRVSKLLIQPTKHIN
jgi:hypothetical protein